MFQFAPFYWRAAGDRALSPETSPEEARTGRASKSPELARLLLSQEAQDLLFAFQRIKAPGLRSAALKAVQAMAGAELPQLPD